MNEINSDAPNSSALPAAPDFDPARLDAFLRERFPDLRGQLTIERTLGGMSNPTYFISYDDRSMVLRKQPNTVLMKSAHAIDREFRVMSALYGSKVPVPKPILYCAERDIVGAPFYLMERLDGRVYQDYTIPEVSAEHRRACYDAMCRAAAAIHTFDWRGGGLSDYGRPGSYFERQLSRWAGQWNEIRATAPNPALDRLIEWLSQRVPQSDLVSLCHGDFRITNLMFHPTKPEVVGVLDWELSTLGHPLVDLAYNTQAWRLAPDENGGLLGQPLAKLGIPSEDEYLEQYYRYSNCPERMTTFHKAFAMFRGAVGSAGVAARARTGISVLPDAARVGQKLSVAHATRALELIENETGWKPQAPI